MYVIGCRESLSSTNDKAKAGKVVDSFMSVVFWTISITRALKDTQNLNLLLIFLGWIFFVFFREPRSYYFIFQFFLNFVTIFQIFHRNLKHSR